MEYLDSIRIRALASIIDPDHEDTLQEIYEWYSKTYYTPLHIVYELPQDDILFVYFRWIYGNFEPEERHNAAIWLLETPEERAERDNSDKKDEEDFIKLAEAKNAKRKAPSAAQKAFDRMQKKFLDNIDQFDTHKKLGAGERIAKPREMPEITLPAAKPEAEEEVTITYMSEEDFERELEKPIGPPPKSRKQK